MHLGHQSDERPPLDVVLHLQRGPGCLIWFVEQVGADLSQLLSRLVTISLVWSTLSQLALLSLASISVEVAGVDWSPHLFVVRRFDHADLLLSRAFIKIQISIRTKFLFLIRSASGCFRVEN